MSENVFMKKVQLIHNNLQQQGTMSNYMIQKLNKANKMY